MRHSYKTRLIMLAAIILGIVISLATSSYAQEPTTSASGATSTSKSDQTPSDNEIKKTLVRSLDKLEATQKASAEKDKVISAQDALIKESEAGKEAATKAAINFKEAFEKQKEATEVAKEGWMAEQKRVRELEKKVRSGSNRTKWILVGAAAAIAATILIK